MHDANQGSTFTSFINAIPRSLLVDILAAGLALEILALSIPIFSQVILDKVVVHNSANTLHVLAAGMLIAVCFEGVLSYLYVLHIGLFTDRLDRRLTGNVVHQLFQLPLSYFERFSKGELMNRLREIAEIRSFLSAMSISTVIDLLFALFVLLIISAYSAKLAFVVLASIPVLAVFSFIVRPIIRRRFAAMNKANENFNAVVAEGVQKIATIKSLGIEDLWRQRWLDAHQRIVTAGLQARRTSAVEEASFRVIHRSVLVAVLWFGATEVLSGALSFGQFVASYMFSLRVIGPSARIFQVVLNFQKIREARLHVDALMAERTEVFGNQSLALPRTRDSSIDLRNVTFTYSLSSTRLPLPRT